MNSPDLYTVNMEEQGFDWFARGIEEKRLCGEVVMVVPRESKRILAITKAFYPEGVYRLPTGGIHCGEEAEDALRRELLEETGFALPVDRFLGRLDYDLRCGDRRVSHASYIYLTKLCRETPACTDVEEKITDFREISIEELRLIADQLRNLEPPWRDWGRFRAIAHDFVAEKIRANPPSF